MTKIEEIKERIILEGGYTDYEECIDLCMKEYAEWYVRKCLEVVIKEYSHVLDRDSILSLHFPSHDGTEAN